MTQPTNTAEGQTQPANGGDNTVQPQSPAPASIPYPAFKARLGKRDARIKALEQELAAAVEGRQSAMDDLSQALPDADNWRSYQAARRDMLKEQVPDYLGGTIDSQPLPEAETLVADFLKETPIKPGTDSRRPSAGGQANRMKPLSTMTSQEHRDTHNDRLSQYR
ncbi:MAG: hypothetical protein IIA59_12155 [Candidatus Marinimicrobia bacterium]|nr:hypothetical protein [Candidatus Neomarinimicrobiota bacterium]